MYIYACMYIYIIYTHISLCTCICIHVYMCMYNRGRGNSERMTYVTMANNANEPTPPPIALPHWFPLLQRSFLSLSLL